MTATKIDRLIVNGPFKEPTRYWTYDQQAELFILKNGRRPAGFVRSSGSGKLDDPGIFVPFELPNRIRERVRKWREAGYPNMTGITRRLLQHWNDPEQREFQFFFFSESSPLTSRTSVVPFLSRTR